MVTFTSEAGCCFNMFGKLHRLKQEEEELLIVALAYKFGIKATLNKRISSSGTQSFRIRISKKSMDNLIRLVKPFFIPEMF